MQLRLFSAFAIFVGSYLPLSLILLAQDIDYNNLNILPCLQWRPQGVCSFVLQNPAISKPIFVTCLIGFCLTLGVLGLITPKHQLRVKEYKYVPSDLMNYSLPYVVSFMSIDYQEWGKFFGLIVFLIWMFWITYKAGQIMMNPVLIAFNWKLYDVTYIIQGDMSGREYTKHVLSRGGMQNDKIYKFCGIQDILIVKN